MKSLKFFKPALATTLAIALGWLLTVRPAQAGYIVTLQQVGPDVVATGSGAIDVTGLGSSTPAQILLNPEIDAEDWAWGIFTGPTSSRVDTYSIGNFSGPGSFGSGGETFASSGSGDVVGTFTQIWWGTDQFLWVPRSYRSGTFLSSRATWSGKTFATLGVTPGTYVWTWGTGPNQNFTLQIEDGSPTPPPTVAQIDGSGTIAAPRGHGNAQFSIFDVEHEQLPNSQVPEGQFSYLDKKAHIHLTNGTIQTVTINGNQGAFTGIGSLGGVRNRQMVQFTVTVTANEGAVPDTFSIVLDNGYAASGNLTSGSVRISTLDPDPD